MSESPSTMFFELLVWRDLAILDFFSIDLVLTFLFLPFVVMDRFLQYFSCFGHCLPFLSDILLFLAAVVDFP